MSSYHHPPHQPYTPLQQDRQARNRPAHIHGAAPRSGGRSGGPTAAAASTTRQQKPHHQQRAALARDETFEERERRYNAARILESNEMLIWHSVARNESLPQTRLHFEKIVAGFDSDDSDPEWEDATPPPPPPPPQQQQSTSGGSNNNNNKRDRDSNSPASRKSRSGTPA